VTNETLPLPAPGLPISAAAVTAWFVRTYGREPSDREVGAIIDAMAERESTSPRVGPHADPQGWSLGPVARPATRR
jgi:hypothetical protein